MNASDSAAAGASPVVDVDVAISGGGVAGASLARRLAVAGLRVLILERTREFVDRVRGEAILPWGVVEAKRLGVLDLLREPVGHELQWLNVSFGRLGTSRRNLLETTPHGCGVLTIFHPSMQSRLLDAASVAGAEVIRGAEVRQIERRDNCVRVHFQSDQGEQSVRAKLLVGADGRNSAVRRLGSFELLEEPPRITAAGVLLDGLRLDSDTGFFQFDLSTGRTSLLLPQRDGRVRSYLFFQHTDKPRLSGSDRVAAFLDESIAAGVSAEVFADACAVGPLASFPAHARWVETPYRDRVVLIGDAAAISDPTWGAGLSSALRDVRILSEQLLIRSNWDDACRNYAREHDQGRRVTHTIDNWYARLFMDPGPDGQALRTRALPKIAQDSSRMPDVFALGPDAPSDESTRRRFFGEA